jgi:delta24(24(1))-sterol reductase
MLIFWNLAGVPLSYCHATLHLSNHLSTITDWKYPSLRTPLLILSYTSYIIIYWIWDTGNSHKHRFRASQRGEPTTRKTFPQLPWQTIHEPRTLMTPDGDTILVGGWYAYARKIHYTCDVYFALMWAAMTGLDSPFPWFYPVFFTCMILHRARRDVRRCRAKYGDTWKEYERMVPWLFIPVW